MKKKTIALIVCLTLIIGCAIGGTIAWLTAQTDPVVNTFTAGDVDITLAETTGETYKMVPGSDISKNPKVTVAANSEKCYLFVKVEKLNNPDSFLTYAIASGWTSLVDTNTDDSISTEGVYFCVVNSSVDSQSFDVLADNKVAVKDTVTKGDLNELTLTTYPQLKFTAYACQWENVNSEYEAWVNVQ